ncbi:MAG: hypothetical protein JWQ09_3258 [Segetibacter sp.]|nr:hypothetical protein [Segetibacter sp.]
MHMEQNVQSLMNQQYTQAHEGDCFPVFYGQAVPYNDSSPLSNNVTYRGRVRRNKSEIEVIKLSTKKSNTN